MARDVVIPGECMVRVKMPYQIFDITDDGQVGELGLSVPDSITVKPMWSHQEIFVDDFGPNIPAELMWRLASVDISMTLVHFDEELLDVCIGEAMGGFPMPADARVVSRGGAMNPTGTMMGNNIALYTSGNHFLGLNLLFSGALNYWFPSTYLTSEPLELPIGTSRQLVKMNWRAIPYGMMNNSGEVISSGIVLFDRINDLG